MLTASDFFSELEPDPLESTVGIPTLDDYTRALAEIESRESNLAVQAEFSHVICSAGAYHDITWSYPEGVTAGWQSDNVLSPVATPATGVQFESAAIVPQFDVLSTSEVKAIRMFRIDSGEHVFVNSEEECMRLVRLGWIRGYESEAGLVPRRKAC